MATLLALATGALFAAGTYLVLRRNLVRMVIGLALLSNGANLVIFTAAGLVPGIPPIVPAGAQALPPGTADPLPQALVLTSIVITFGVQAFALALVYREYATAGTEDPAAFQEARDGVTPGVDR